MPVPKDPNAYPVEFFNLFRAASEKPVEIELDRKGAAVNFRQQLYGFRRALKRTSNPFEAIAYSCEVILSPTNENAVIVRPSGWNYREAFAKAGIDLEPIRDDYEPAIPHDGPGPTQEQTDELSATLAGLGFKQESNDADKES